MNYPLVSVVMSVYNAEHFLKKAIESILNQTFRDFEFIVINDASTDKSVEILQSFQDERILLINNPVNLGLTKSLNLGISRARGKYIARMDADDVSLQERLEKQIAFLLDNPDCVVCGTSIAIIDSRGKEKKLFLMVESDEQIRKNLICGNNFVHGSTIFSLSAFRGVGGYDERFRYSQDYDLWLRMIHLGSCHNLPEKLYLYRVNKKSIMATKFVEQYFFAYAAREKASGRDLLLDSSSRQLFLKSTFPPEARLKSKAELMCAYGFGCYAFFLDLYSQIYNIVGKICKIWKR